MRCGRFRIDHELCGYAINANIRVGPDTPWLNCFCRENLDRIIRQEIAFHCGIDVRKVRIDAHGFTLVCDVPPDTPSEAEVRAAWHARYAGTPREDEIDRPGMIEKIAKRMRDISWLVRLIKQRFMQWYNRTHGASGSVWEGRFRSLVRTAGESVRRVVRRFRREMFPRSAHGDPLWKEVIELGCRIIGRAARSMAGQPILHRI